MTPNQDQVPPQTPDEATSQLVVLRDDRRVLVRRVRAGDREALDTAFRRLSPESQQLRFGSAPRRLGRAALRHLVDTVDGTDHVAFAAFPVEQPERLVGVGRVLRYPDDPDSLDVGLTVADDYQGAGLGSVIAGLLATHRPNPAQRVITQIAVGNRRAMALLAAFGSPHRSADGQVVVVLEDPYPS